MANAHGKYCVYLADDDRIDPKKLAIIISNLQDQPSVGACYTPWRLNNNFPSKNIGQFYHAPYKIISKGDHKSLLNFILDHNVWPEIGVYREDVIKNVSQHSTTVNYHFSLVARIIRNCDVLFDNRSFYEFLVHSNDQEGNKQSIYHVDKYRAGLEYILGHVNSGITADERLNYFRKIQDWTKKRLRVSLRLASKTKDSVLIDEIAHRLAAHSGLE
jgi:glycosyltransferase involved in cell wall biosynthesis